MLKELVRRKLGSYVQNEKMEKAAVWNDMKLFYKIVDNRDRPNIGRK